MPKQKDNKSAKMQHFSLSWQNTVTFGTDFTELEVFYTSIACMLLCFFPSMTIKYIQSIQFIQPHINIQFNQTIQYI